MGKRKLKYPYLVISHQKHYFDKHQSDYTHRYTEVEIKNVLEFLINNIFVVGD
jgi:hypothetical protein